MHGRYFVREQQETQVSQVELFLNSVPILASLSRDERIRLVDALEEIVFQPGGKVSNHDTGLNPQEPASDLVGLCRSSRRATRGTSFTSSRTGRLWCCRTLLRGSARSTTSSRQTSLGSVPCCVTSPGMDLLSRVWGAYNSSSPIVLMQNCHR